MITVTCAVEALVRAPTLPQRNTIYQSIAWFAALAFGIVAVANLGILIALALGVL